MMTMIRNIALGLSLTLAAAPAMASPRDGQGASQHRKHPRGEEGEKKAFPMPADEFRKLAEGRIEKVRQRLEAHISDKKLDDEKARQLRERFAAGAAKVRAEIDKVCEDGTVTREEAHQVRELARSMAPRHGEGHGKHKKGRA